MKQRPSKTVTFGLRVPLAQKDQFKSLPLEQRRQIINFLRATLETAIKPSVVRQFQKSANIS